MSLQKKLNKRVIKMAIGSKYVYEIEAEEKMKTGYYDKNEEGTSSKLKSFIKDGVKEMKKEMKKDL